MTFVDEHGEVHEDLEATAGENRSKASFKLDLIETVAADPAMQPSDLALVVAYVAMMQWPSREAWLSTSRARAASGLSERQVNNSRARLQERGYFEPVRMQGTTKIYRIANPHRADIRQHVAITTEHLKAEQNERQSVRRRLWKARHANSAETEEPLSQSPGECDIPANFAGNFPVESPEYSSEGKEPLRGSAASYGEDDDPSVPYPVPESEDELVAMLAEFGAAGFSGVVVGYFRKKLQEGKLTPAMVQEQRRFAS